MRLLRSALLFAAIAAYSTPVSAAPILIDFETFTDLEDVTTQFSVSGLLFSGATALLSGAVGGSLNEMDFPPFSGNAVVYDSSASGIRVDFLTGALSVAGRFTYAAPVTMTAYSGGTVLGTITSQFGTNIATGLNPANEILQLAFSDPVTHVTFVGDSAFGASFVMDDFFANTVDEVSTSPVPEPGTLTLLFGGIVAIVAHARSRRASRSPDPDRARL